MDDDRELGDPSRDEIAERCAEIRRLWSPDEEARRRGGGMVPQTREERSRDAERRRGS